MASEAVSKARQALRDYAREGHEIALSSVPGWGDKAPVGARVAVVRGEAAGEAFVAAQAALTVAEELRAEELPDNLSPDERFGWRQCRDEAADRIEAAVLKALTP